MTRLDAGLALTEASGMVVVPGARYTSRQFFDLEMERLWPRVWQVACREEEVAARGDFLEYTIGDQSILVVRTDTDTIKAYFNACSHRGTRLAEGVGNFATSQIRCRYHAWRWNLAGEIVEVVDRDDYPPTMSDDDVHLGEVQVGRWGGFVFVNMDPNGESFESFMGVVPKRYASYRLEELRFRSYRTILFECNWKTAVDSFNEGYHPQGLHPQMLTWFDDTLFDYHQLGQHSCYQQRERRREIGPSPRLGLGPDDFDAGELIAERVDAMAGLFSRADQAVLEELRRQGPPPGKTAAEVFDEIRTKAMRGRGYDLTDVSDDELLINGTIHLFPNLVGPLNHGNATLYRIRPDGLHPDRAILDYWALEWPTPGADPPPIERKFYADWTTKDWGTINNQDFATFAEVAKGMKSRGFRGARLNPVQEANVIHHQRVIDRYLTS